MKSFLLWFFSSLGLGLFMSLLCAGPTFDKYLLWTVAVTTLFWMGMLAPMLMEDKN